MRGRILLGGLVLLALALTLTACGAASTPAPTATLAPPPTQPPPAPTLAPPTPVPPTPTPAYDLGAIQAAWEAGPHNNKYDLGKGPNTYCSMCHSPQNWDPKATVGTAPNCVSCKFPFDKEVRNAPENPLIPEDQWKPIGCTVCHPSGKGPEYAIWNNGTGKYDSVLTTTALCEKCHVDSLGGTRHKIQLGGGAHSNQIGTTVARPEFCTDCHDPHSGEASCTTCHDVRKADTTIVGHMAMHAKVECVACHDASGLEVSPVEPDNLWTTGTTASARGATTFTPKFSHDFQKAVDCARCHFTGNKWGLWEPTPTPAPQPTASR